MNVAQSIVKMLESLSVDAIFTGSGQGSGDILFAFAESEKIKTIMTRHEQAASFMAYGYAMTSHKLGVCNAQGGPGSYNLFSGLGMAYTGSFPVMSIGSYSPRKWRGKGDLGEVTGLNRTPDSQAMFAATTKKTFLIERPEQACDLFEEAVNLAYEGRPGPVHIDLPYDVAAMETSHHRDIKVDVKPVLPAEKDIRIFAEYLDQAIRSGKKVLAYFGNGCVLSGADSELLEFVERFQLPFITTMDAKGVIADNHPLSVGMGGTCGDIGARQSFKDADVVLAVGCSFAKWQSWRFQEDLFDNKVLMHINLDGHEIGKVYNTDLSMVSDAKAAIKALSAALGSRLTVKDKAKPLIDRHCFQAIDYDGSKVHPGQLSQEFGRLLPDKAIVLGDAGAHMIWMAAYMQFNRGQTFKNPGSFGPMSSHTNAAIGVQLAAPDRRVIVGCGDGCYQMAGFELMTAVQNRIPIIWVIYNNSEFNIIKLFNLVAHGKEVFNHILGPDFAEYAKLCGANGFRVDKLDQFEPAFKAALASDMPSVINVITDEQCVMPFKFYDQD